LIKGKKSLSTAHQEIEFDKVQIRDRIRALLEKSGKRNLSQKEKKELNKLRDDEQYSSMIY
jgi:flagellar basal body-associated protein FliL